jgi:hypothetical protein
MDAKCYLKCVGFHGFGTLMGVCSLYAAPPGSAAPALPSKHPAETQVSVKCKIYAVDSAVLAKFASKTKAPIPEFLHLNGFPKPKSDTQFRAIVCVVSEKPLSFDLHGQNVAPAFDRVFSPQVRTIAGLFVEIDIGTGNVPIPNSLHAGPKATRGSRGAGNKFEALPTVEADGSIKLYVRFEQSRSGDETGEEAVEINGLKIPTLSTHAMSLAAKLKSDQYLFVVHRTSESDVTQLMQLQAHVIPAEKPELPTPASKAASRAEPQRK